MMCPPGYHHNGFRATPERTVGTGCTVTDCGVRLHCGVIRGLKLRAPGNGKCK